MGGNPVSIFDLDGSVKAQETLVEIYRPNIIDAREIGPEARLWANRKTREDILRRLRGIRKSSITFLGSGDFHHISELLMRQIDEPFSLIVFDHHPDWDIAPAPLGCGSWLSAALANTHMKKCVLVGVSSHDISTFFIQTGNLRALANNRLEIYPYAHRPTTVFFRKVPANVSIKKEEGPFSTAIRWNQIKNSTLSGIVSESIERMPTKKVYLSIDKDCLKSDDALTNWEEGMVSLDELLSAVRVIKERTEMIGADIVGDYSPVIVNGFFKKAASVLDHPARFTARGVPKNRITGVNETTNLKLLEVLSS